MAAIPSQMTAIGIKAAGGPDMLVRSSGRSATRAEKSVKVAAAGVTARCDAAHGTLSSAARRA
jgi:hypothetical protein